MHSLNKKSESIFRKLTEGMTFGDSRKIANSDSFMPVSIEVINRHHKSLVVSVAHYFEQHGDLCCDPDMTFLVNDTGIYAMSFQQAIPPVYQEAIRIEDDSIKWNEKLQKELTSFANDWMRNIEAQQF